jgi:hypothetical protein
VSPKSLVVVIACCATASFAPAARAQEGGGGLYAPFPEPAKGGQAQSFIEELGVNAGIRDLDRGRFVGPAARWDAPALPAPASRRAGVDSSSAVWLLVPLLAALGVAAAVDRRRWT